MTFTHYYKLMTTFREQLMLFMVIVNTMLNHFCVYLLFNKFCKINKAYSFILQLKITLATAHTVLVLEVA